MKVKIGNYPTKGNRRKTDIQIDEFDTWSLDHTLANIIYPALIQLKQTKNGIPNEFVAVGGEDWTDQESFDFYKESHNDAFNEGVKKWDETLDKMIWAFHQICFDDYGELYHHGTPKFSWEKSNVQINNPVTGKLDDTFQMTDNNPEEHWYDSVGHMLHEERIREGLELFGKYYRALWD